MEQKEHTVQYGFGIIYTANNNTYANAAAANSQAPRTSAGRPCPRRGWQTQTRQPPQRPH